MKKVNELNIKRRKDKAGKCICKFPALLKFRVS